MKDIPTDKMTPEDTQKVRSMMELYSNGVTPPPEIVAEANALVEKYGIKVNRNPPKLKSRFIKIRHNVVGPDGTILPFRNPVPKP